MLSGEKNDVAVIAQAVPVRRHNYYHDDSATESMFDGLLWTSRCIVSILNFDLLFSGSLGF